MCLLLAVSQSFSNVLNLKHVQGIRIRVGTHQLQMAKLFGEALSNLSIVTTIHIKSGHLFKLEP